MIIMMTLAFHPVNTYTRYLRAKLHSLLSVKKSDFPVSGSAIKHAMADMGIFFYVSSHNMVQNKMM